MSYEQTIHYILIAFADPFEQLYIFFIKGTYKDFLWKLQSFDPSEQNGAWKDK